MIVQDENVLHREIEDSRACELGVMFNIGLLCVVDILCKSTLPELVQDT